MIDLNDLIWTEGFRPKNVDECILPKKLKKHIKSLIKKDTIPNNLSNMPSSKAPKKLDTSYLRAK